MPLKSALVSLLSSPATLYVCVTLTILHWKHLLLPELVNKPVHLQCPAECLVGGRVNEGEESRRGKVYPTRTQTCDATERVALQGNWRCLWAQLILCLLTSPPCFLWRKMSPDFRFLFAQPSFFSCPRETVLHGHRISLHVQNTCLFCDCHSGQTRKRDRLQGTLLISSFHRFIISGRSHNLSYHWLCFCQKFRQWWQIIWCSFASLLCITDLVTGSHEIRHAIPFCTYSYMIFRKLWRSRELQPGVKLWNSQLWYPCCDPDIWRHRTMYYLLSYSVAVVLNHGYTLE